MARNRKSQSAAIRFGPALKASVLCLLIGGSGVGYVWQKDQLVRLGQQTKLREKRLEALERQNTKFRRQLADLYSPRYLEQRIKDLKLGLVLPQATQTTYLPEPGTDGPPTTVRPRYVSQNTHSLIMP
jgi:hypothetical protein